MADAAHDLRLKYELPDAPSLSQIREWAVLTRKYINQGMSLEAAGYAAAKCLIRH